MNLKKSLGQNFLRNQDILYSIVEHAEIKKNSYILEIGCGDLALSHKLIQEPISSLTIVELDVKWAAHALNALPPKITTVYNQDILKFDFNQLLLKSEKWSIIANIPYYITYEIMHKIVDWKANITKAILLIQEEVAQKIVKNHGRDYTSFSLFMQYHFDIKLHEKVGPESFYPAPKVNSRIIELVPKEKTLCIKNEKKFWAFIRIIFSQPRRTIANNIKGTTYQGIVPEKYLIKRAQELNLEELVDFWNIIN